MENKVSKAQLEVWEWKELLYNEISNLPKEQRIDYILNKVKGTLEKINKERGLCKKVD